ncbi:MAG: PadR family transcriptional regulator, regulatory protein PadR [Solirubrobacteraceae bacterium]|jgi:DNA-binding PadR family transcriptional regulator|nr:PadR family transcriptional regulator, regulatory protein PadR [Solirubrobacteraceae bacterium]
MSSFTRDPETQHADEPRPASVPRRITGRDVELSEETGLPSGTVYPILRRLEAEGLIEGTWTTVQTRVQGRRRRYYRLTSAGKQVAAEAVAAQRETLRLHAPGWVTP